MARRFNNDNTEYLEIDSAVITAYPTAFACWAYILSDTTTNQSLINLPDKDVTNHYLGLFIGRTDETTFTSRVVRVAGSTFDITDTSTTTGLATWNHYCGIFASATDARVFLDNAGKITDTTSRAFPTGVDRTTIARTGDSTPINEADARIAEVAMWDLSGWPGATDALRATSFENTALPALAKGFSPLFYPLGLAGHWPLVRDNDLDKVGDFNMTAFNTPTVEDHPPDIIYPAPTNVGFTAAAVAANAPTADIQGPLIGPLGGPIAV